MSDELVTIATFDKRGDSDLCKIFLEQEGIRAFVADDKMVGGTNFFYALALGGIKVQVASSDAERATALLRGFKGHPGFIAHTKKQPDAGGTICFDCEHCEQPVEFPSAAAGSVQNCPICGEFVDVPDS